MYLNHNESLRGQTILIDPYVHKKTKLTRERFLEKVKSVKQIRTAYNTYYISFYITSIDENNNLLKFHNLINKGVFDFESYYVFAVAVQPKLYSWFKSTDITTIQKQIACWLASAYFFQPEKKEIYERQIYKPLLEEMYGIIDRYFRGFSPGQNNKKCIEKYLQVCKEFYQSEPPEFLTSPFEYKNLNEWGVNDYHNFEFVEAYFLEKDWRNIIEGGSNDTLYRAESRDELWLKWKHIYSTFSLRKNFVYSFYFEPNKEKLTKIKQAREKIPQVVKDQVWNRDGGKCVECESNYNLEFDHIIPVSKGGASTYRNIQLLCEPCNRRKSSKI